jgi:hypothetical protein
MQNFLWGLGDCRIACEANQGSWTGVRTRCPEGPPPTLRVNIKYCISHQGTGVWAGPDGNTILSGEQLRNSLKGGQTDWSHGQKPSWDQLDKANITDLERLTPEVVRECAEERNIAGDIKWVWDHEGKRWEMWAALNRNDYNAIRSIFSNTQRHDDNLRNRVYCLSGRQLESIIRPWGNPGPPPTPTKPGRSHIDHPGKPLL